MLMMQTDDREVTGEVLGEAGRVPGPVLDPGIGDAGEEADHVNGKYVEYVYILIL